MLRRACRRSWGNVIRGGRVSKPQVGEPDENGLVAALCRVVPGKDGFPQHDRPRQVQWREVALAQDQPADLTDLHGTQESLGRVVFRDWPGGVEVEHRLPGPEKGQPVQVRPQLLLYLARKEPIAALPISGVATTATERPAMSSRQSR